MDLLRVGAEDEPHLAWLEGAVRTCPVAMAEFGGFYGQARARLAPLLADPGRRLFLLGEAAGDLVGFLDVDAAEASECADLAFFVLPPARGRGVASAALGRADDRLPESVVRLRAAVDPANAASAATLIRAGFDRVADNEFGEHVYERGRRRGAVPGST